MHTGYSITTDQWKHVRDIDTAFDTHENSDLTNSPFVEVNKVLLIVVA